MIVLKPNRSRGLATKSKGLSLGLNFLGKGPRRFDVSIVL